MSITGIAWGMYSVYGRKFDNFFGYTYNSFLLFGLANVALISLTFPLMGSRPWMDISPKDFALALYMGMISTALSYVLWNGVLKKLKASQGGLVQLLVPVVTSGLGVLLLSEKVTPALVLGGSLVLAAMYVNGSSRING
jgi:drug/metabolite transporter (DMT)-like permease